MPTGSVMRILSVGTAIAMALVSISGCDAGNGLDKVNGSVTVPAGAHANEAHTVNGAIAVGHDAVVGAVHTVNGAINLQAKAHAQSLKTVNGSVRIDAGASVACEVVTVNGGIQMAAGSTVDGRIVNVNGAISLDHATVGGGIETVNGDVTIGSGAIVRGGLTVRRPQGLFGGANRAPRIVIAADATVQGTLRFDRPVDLQVAPGAKIGPIVGATASAASGK